MSARFTVCTSSWEVNKQGVNEDNNLLKPCVHPNSMHLDSVDRTENGERVVCTVD